jgi:hypothetical protein
LANEILGTDAASTSVRTGAPGVEQKEGQLQQVEAKTRAPNRGRTIGLAAAPRNFIAGLASAGVLALLVFYAVAAPTASLSASVGPVVPEQGSTTVVLGRVLSSSGGGLGGARIAVARDGADRPLATGRSDASGAFQVEVPGRCAVYDISIEARAEGTTVRKTDQRRLCPGDALPVDARVKTQGHFLWVPGPR